MPTHAAVVASEEASLTPSIGSSNVSMQRTLFADSGIASKRKREASAELLRPFPRCYRKFLYRMCVFLKFEVLFVRSLKRVRRVRAQKLTQQPHTYH